MTTRTPENTPIPGGGRWRWNAKTTQWDPAPDPTDTPVPEATEPPARNQPTESKE